MARIRKLLSLDPDVEAHRKALEILEAHGCSSDFIVECILHYENLLTREDLQQELEKFLQRKSPDVSESLDMERVDDIRESSSAINQIPAAMFDLMKQI
ncbi:MAG: hypothetical protein MR966_05295 [Lachnospiraceae bacterium]|nr:hypothetical protein [Lachnospiraceae bacterium]